MQTAETWSEPPLTVEAARRIVSETARCYFESRRARVDAFVERHFSFSGSLALHRKALGWDMLRMPANVVLAVPHVGVQLAAKAAGMLGARRMSGTLASRRILLETAVGREIEWLVMTELLELPFRQTGRSSRKDALAEAILAAPEIEAVLSEAGEAIARRRGDPAFRRQLEQMMATYTGTRTAAAEITTALITLGSGAAALKQVTPGAMVLGPALAGVIAHQAAVASFPLGATLGGLWYAAFPVAASSGLIATMTGGVLAASAVAAAFSGIIADPMQRLLGLHRGRLLRLIAALEQQFSGGEAGFIVRDHYVARLLSLVELLVSAWRLAGL